MELEQLKRLSGVNTTAILSKRIDPLGTELEVAKDSLRGMSVIRVGEREVTIPGMKRQQDIILQALASFKDERKKNYIPVQYAKADDLIMEPIWRPAIFALNNFKVTSAGTAPASNNIIPRIAGNFTLDDDELIIITDIIECSAQEGFLEHQFKVDETQQYTFSVRPAIKVGDLRIYELDFPIIADVNLDWDGRSETISTEFEPMPCGVHILKASLMKAISAGA